MATLRRLGFLTGLMLTACLCTGCNVMALPFFLIPGLQATVDPKVKLASDDKDVIVHVAILSSAGLETRPEFIRADNEITHKLVAKLQDGFKKKKQQVVFIPISKIEKYKDEHPNWHSL